MKPLHCQNPACDVLLGRMYPVRNKDTYAVTSYEFVPYAISSSTQEAQTSRAIGSMVKCWKTGCDAQTPILYPEAT